MLALLRAVIGYLSSVFIVGIIVMTSVNAVFSEEAKKFLFGGNLDYTDGMILITPLAAAISFIGLAFYKD